MEAIKGVVEKVFYGEQHATTETKTPGLEPQSGVSGNTAEGEPFDGGNLDQSNPGSVGGSGYTKEDDAHAFKTSHELPRGDGATGSSFTHGGNEFTGGSGYTKEDDSHAFRTSHEIPRGEGEIGSSHTHGGTGFVGGSGYTKEDDANAFKTSHELPRGEGATGSSHTHGGTGLTGSHVGSTNAGPHDSNVANKLDPTVDSDRDGRSGVSGLTGSHVGSTNAGPHDSNVANKLDPTVDSDRDGRSGISGQHNTQSQGGIGADVSKAAAVATGGAIGGSAAQHSQRGTDYENRDTSGNNLNEYSVGEATHHAKQQQEQDRQPHIADASHRNVTEKHEGANAPLDEPGHSETHAIRDTKDEAERKLDPANDSESYGPKSTSGVAGQDAPTGRHGSMTGNLPGAPGGEGLKKTTGEGTGKEYVKSTGLAAEGGDFDASRPGAGKEADRLLEERGIHHSEQPKADPEASSKATGTHSHGAHTGTPGTVGAHDQNRGAETSSTTAIRHGVPGETVGTNTSASGAKDTTGAHSGTHGEGPLHADLTGVRHDKGHGNDGVHGSVAEGTTDQKPSLKEKIKAKIHMH